MPFCRVSVDLSVDTLTQAVAPPKTRLGFFFLWRNSVMAVGRRPSSLLGVLGLLFVARLGIAASEKSLNSSEVTIGATISTAVDNGTESIITTGLNSTDSTMTTQADGKTSGNDENGMALNNVTFEKDNTNTGIAATVDVIVLGGDSIMLCANASLPSDSILDLVQTGQSSYKIIVDPARDNVTTDRDLPKSVNVSCPSSMPESLPLSVRYAPRTRNIEVTRGNGSANAEGECGRDLVSCIFDANPPVNISFKFDDHRDNSIPNRRRGRAELDESSCIVREENRIEIRLNVSDASELVCVGENMLGNKSVAYSLTDDAGDTDPQVYWGMVGEEIAIDMFFEEKSFRYFNLRKDNTWFFRHGECIKKALCGKWTIDDGEDTVKVTVPDASMDDAGHYFVDSRSIHFDFYINVNRDSRRNPGYVDFPKEAVLDGRPIVLCANPSLPKDSNLSLVYGSGNSFRIKLKNENDITDLPKFLEVSCENSTDFPKIPLLYKPRLGQIEVERESAGADDAEYVEDDCGRDRVVCHFDANPPADVSLVYHRCNDQNLWDAEGPLQSKNACIKHDENRLEVRLNLVKITEKVKVVCTGQNSVSKSSSFVDFDCAADPECVYSSRSHDGVNAVVVVVIIIVLVAIAIVAQRFFPRNRQQRDDRESFEGRFNLAEARVESGAAPQLAHPEDKCASKL